MQSQTYETETNPEQAETITGGRNCQANDIATGEWKSHGIHMGFIWTSHGSHMGFKLKQTQSKQILSQGVETWASHGGIDATLRLHTFHMEVTWASHGGHMGFTWRSHGLCMEVTWASHERPMGFTWISLGFIWA